MGLNPTKHLPCDCYECVGEERAFHNGHTYTVNNMKWHTFLEPCADCGELKTEYLDLGRKGYYVCWWCEKRTGGPKA